MSEPHEPHPASEPGVQDAAERARAEEETLRERWETTQAGLRDRFEAPLTRAAEITEKTLAWFPVRVWRHFLQNNGFLLAAGVSYQALFAIFAGIYVAFAIVGLWLGGSPQAVQALIDVINGYIPGLISDTSGVVTPEQVEQIASSTATTFGVTGLIAVGVLIWTAIGWVTFSRRAVRDLFGLPPDRRSYFLLKARDLLAAFIFGVALLVGSALSTVGTYALDWFLALFGLNLGSFAANTSVTVTAVIVSLLLNTVALAALYRFLSGASLRWRLIWPGAVVAGVATGILQLGVGLLISYTPSNALLATFAIFIGLLLWFRLNSIVMLVGAAWIAVAAKDRDVPLVPQTEAERLAAEHRALLVAAQVRLRTAEEAREAAPWYGVWTADRAVRRAEAELQEVEASAPPPPPKHGRQR